MKVKPEWFRHIRIEADGRSDIQIECETCGEKIQDTLRSSVDMESVLLTALMHTLQNHK